MTSTGVHLTDGADPPVFRHVATSGTAELQTLVQQIVERIGRMLEKRGLIEQHAHHHHRGRRRCCETR